MENLHFKAPWGKALKLISALVTVGLLVLSGFLFDSVSTSSPAWVCALSFLPPAILLGSLPFMVKGYSIGPGRLDVERLFWKNHYDLSKLKKVTADPELISGSIRLFGNGGLYSFTGIFSNKKLGRYRAFVNDLQNVVVLEFEENTIAVSPDNPQMFVEAVEQNRS